MVTSVRRGTRTMVTGSLARMLAARIGSAAFFAPLAVTLPTRGRPPMMVNRCIRAIRFYRATNRERNRSMMLARLMTHAET
jgi:hypothetical protein